MTNITEQPVLFDSGRFIAVTVDHWLFKNRYNDCEAQLIEGYQLRFNSVTAVTEKWSDETARHAIRARLKMPGINIALFDGHQNGKIIGGYLAYMVPGAEGWNLLAPDLFIEDDEQFKGKRLGQQLSLIGKVHADAVCQQANKEFIAENIGETYRIPKMPKEMWERVGYKLEPLFHLTGRELANSTFRAQREAISEETQVEVANFITQQGTLASDSHGYEGGNRWSQKRAENFVSFMHENNPAALNILRLNDQIVAVTAGFVMPGRKNPEVLSPLIFAKNQDALDAAFSGRVSMRDVVSAAYCTLQEASDTISRNAYRRKIGGIAMDSSGVDFLSSVFPYMAQTFRATESAVFLGMKGPRAKLVAGLGKDIEERERQNALDRVAFYNNGPAQLAWAP